MAVLGIIRMQILFDSSKVKNEHLAKLEKIYDINPRCFFGFIDLLLNRHSWISFQGKVECRVRSPKLERIYPAVAQLAGGFLFVLDNEKILLNPEKLKMYITLITTRQQGCPRILVITSDEHKTEITEQIAQYLPEQINGVCYDIGLIDESGFNKAYEHVKKLAVKDTMKKLKRLSDKNNRRVK